MGATLTGVGAVLLLAGISAVAGLLDVLAGSALRLIFAAGLVLGTLIASLLVVRRDLLTVVFAPPLVFVAASAVAVLLGRGETGGGLIDLATSWLVYGFPAMATATAVARRGLADPARPRPVIGPPGRRCLCSGRPSRDRSRCRGRPADARRPRRGGAARGAARRTASRRPR